MVKHKLIDYGTFHNLLWFPAWLNAFNAGRRLMAGRGSIVQGSAKTAVKIKPAKVTRP
jgi:hypothetical protein